MPTKKRAIHGQFDTFEFSARILVLVQEFLAHLLCTVFIVAPAQIPSGKLAYLLVLS